MLKPRTYAALAVLVASAASAQIAVDPFSGLTSSLYVTGGQNGISTPTDIRWLPAPDGRMVLITKGGTFYIRQNNGQLSSGGTFSVDSGSEKGLLGIEVDPDFTNNKKLYFYYSASNGIGGTDLDRHRVVMRTLGTNDQLSATETILLRGLRGPANHDGGALAIGPDGKLYVGVGDTGCNASCCPAANRFNTCLTNGNGKILRINLDGSIPSDNPLVPFADGGNTVTACGNNCTDAVSASTKGPPRTDIWAWGFRNPWRISFDKVNGNLWVGDVGESAEEEVDVVQKGKHYGYPWYEGFRGNNGYTATVCDQYTPGSGNCEAPVHSCLQSGGQCSRFDGGTDTNCSCQSMTGGEINDHCSWPAQTRGNYFFADYNSNGVFMLKLNASRLPSSLGKTRVASGMQGPVAVRVGPDGALYVVDITSSRVVRFAPVAPISCDGGFGGGAGGGAGGAGGSGGAGGTGGAGGGGGGAAGGAGGSGGGAATGGGAGGSGGGAATGGGTGGSGGGAATGGGTGGSGGGSATGGGSGTGGGSATGGGSGTGGGGSVPAGSCGCAAGASNSATLWTFGATFFLLGLVLRRRRA